jgi:hypothetical protein
LRKPALFGEATAADKAKNATTMPIRMYNLGLPNG